MCKYCIDDNSKREFFDKDENSWLWKYNGVNYLIIDGSIGDKIVANYCPICGEKL